jgi:hypothetical protein
MAITEPEWASIRALVQRMVGHGGKDNFFSARVVKNDVAKKLVWVQELGNQPIPLVGFDYSVKFYDTNASGTVLPQTAVASPKVPDVGDTVFIVKEMGAQSLPRCLGTIQGRGWILPEDETGFGGDV